jgi:GNAT superfamily N-acetyltransferase
MRCPLPTESAELSRLAMRSKAHWGYSDEFMNSCLDELTYGANEIANGNVEFAVAEVSGKIAGFYALTQLSPTEFDLEALFVDPGNIGKGYGGLLLNHALSAVQKKGGEQLQIQSDPNAEEFYAAAGARQLGTRESGSIPGRFLSLLVIDI